MASWTLMNPPALRSKDNARPGIPAELKPEEPQITLSTDEISRRLRDQPPLFLMVTRTSSNTVELTHALTNDVIYRIRDTGRSHLSSKPDYEIFRPGSGDLFVGSIRIGIRGTEVKLPLTDVKLSDIESFTSQNGAKLHWTTSHVGRKKKTTEKPDADTSRDSISWVATLECSRDDQPSPDDNLVCAVKLIDGMPNGRFEIWTKDACVDVGGDWNLLDELVAVAYANMEKARRKVMSGPDPSSLGMAGMGMGLSSGAFAIGS